MTAGCGKVLIADDEPLILAIVEAEFEDAGFQVVLARDGKSALALLEQDADIGLLFTDIRMPGEIDGWKLAKLARQIKPGLPVIYGTGFSDEQLQIVEGGLLFMKPYRLSSIVDAARSLQSTP